MVNSENQSSISLNMWLSVLMYATVMDKIAEEINKYELGVNTNNTSHPKLGCLLYVDDVVLISNSAQ